MKRQALLLITNCLAVFPRVISCVFSRLGQALSEFSLRIEKPLDILGCKVGRKSCPATHQDFGALLGDDGLTLVDCLVTAWNPLVGVYV